MEEEETAQTCCSQRRCLADDGAESFQSTIGRSIKGHTGIQDQEKPGRRQTIPMSNDAEAPGVRERHLFRAPKRPWQPSIVLNLVVVLLFQYSEIAKGDRAGDALFLDGGQEPFNSTDPPSPGFVYLTPRKSSRGLPPWVSRILDTKCPSCCVKIHIMR